jgi:hypothetical protein
MGNDEAIKNSEFLQIYGLTQQEFLSIAGYSSYLNSYLAFVKKLIGATFKCDPINKCSQELILQQLSNAAVTKFVGYNNIKALLDTLEPGRYLYNDPIEFSSFYINKYNITDDKNVSMSIDQLNNLYYGDNNILDAASLVDLYIFNINLDLHSAYKSFKLRSFDQLKIFSDYVFNYLPEVLLNITFSEDKIGKISISKESQTFVLLLNHTLKASYSKINEQILPVLHSLLISNVNKINCTQVIFEATNNNTEKINFICNNNDLNMNSYESVKKWIYIFDCINVNNCKDEEKQNLQKAANLTQVIILYK